MTTNESGLKVLVLGANGFIGHHLSGRILATTNWEIDAMDLACDRLAELRQHPRFRFLQGDMTVDLEWVYRRIEECDVVLPLVAIATPATYVTDPLRIFELDFEANLPVIRAAAKANKRVVFPSTSEVYGMNTDEEFDPDTRGGSARLNTSLG
jgi:nucleoside-diphosphate-sugar epimerase